MEYIYIYNITLGSVFQIAVGRTCKVALGPLGSNQLSGGSTYSPCAGDQGLFLGFTISGRVGRAHLCACVRE